MNIAPPILAYAVPPLWAMLAALAVLTLIPITIVAAFIAILQWSSYRGGQVAAIITVILGVGAMSLLVTFTGFSIFIEVWSSVTDALITSLLLIGIISSLWILLCRHKIAKLTTR